MEEIDLKAKLDDVKEDIVEETRNPISRYITIIFGIFVAILIGLSILGVFLSDADAGPREDAARIVLTGK